MEPYPLAGNLVGLSISDSPDLRALGLSQSHFRHMFIELARQLLSAGASLGYGGDLRASGFTEILIDLLHTYSSEDRPDQDRMRFYLAWPMWDRLPSEQRARLRTIATVISTDPPRGDSAEAVPGSLDAKIDTANSLTLMRRRMTDDIQARIVLGGQMSTFTGRYPGIAEEAVLTVRAGKPVYILGGFGGCAEQLAELVRGSASAALTIDTLRARVPGYAELIASLPDVSDESMSTTLRTAGIGGLHNGLSVEDNQILFESSDADVITALVLRGIRAVTQRDNG